MGMLETLRSRPELGFCDSCLTSQYLDTHDPDQCAINMTPDEVIAEVLADEATDRAQEARHGL